MIMDCGQTNCAEAQLLSAKMLPLVRLQNPAPTSLDRNCCMVASHDALAAAWGTQYRVWVVGGGRWAVGWWGWKGNGGGGTRYVQRPVQRGGRRRGSHAASKARGRRGPAGAGQGVGGGKRPLAVPSRGPQYGGFVIGGWVAGARWAAASSASPQRNAVGILADMVKDVLRAVDTSFSTG